jgi:hypothetical protein
MAWRHDLTLAGFFDLGEVELAHTGFSGSRGTCTRKRQKGERDTYTMARFEFEAESDSFRVIYRRPDPTAVHKMGGFPASERRDARLRLIPSPVLTLENVCNGKSE